MICRNYREGEQLKVADLNRIVVLIDRSETALTEVGWNIWRTSLVGPPHFHNEKEQIFYITSGVGKVVVGTEEYQVKPGSLVYVPAGTVHQTIVTGAEDLTYLLFNAFLSESKEGHASFKDHIRKVKNIRKQQAETGHPEVRGKSGQGRDEQSGKFFPNIAQGKLFEFGSNITRLLLDQAETQRCEAVVVIWPKGNRGAMVSHKEKEQTFFVLSGSGLVTVGEETKEVHVGDVVFIPWKTPHTTEARHENLSYLCINTYIVPGQYESFEAMYRKIAPGRRKRWESGDSGIGD